MCHCDECRARRRGSAPSGRPPGAPTRGGERPPRANAAPNPTECEGCSCWRCNPCIRPDVGSAPTAPRCSKFSRMASASATSLCVPRALRSAMKPTPQASNSRLGSNKPCASGNANASCGAIFGCCLVPDMSIVLGSGLAQVVVSGRRSGPTRRTLGRPAATHPCERVGQAALISTMWSTEPPAPTLAVHSVALRVFRFGRVAGLGTPDAASRRCSSTLLRGPRCGPLSPCAARGGLGFGSRSA